MIRSRHAYIIPKQIDRNGFMMKALRMTKEDLDLIYYIHDHTHTDHVNGGQCRDSCTVIYQGKVTQKNQLPITS